LGAVETETRKKTKVKKPSKYMVLILNDDYTTWDFVVATLVRIFNKTEQEAHSITENVHHGGEGVCGVYTKEIAESKVSSAMEFAKINHQPLRTIMKQV
jgi:ATP-dependent Clp protease adaptor protein ClpS